MLDSWGCVIETAESSAQAAEIITDGFRPDLLIVDYHLVQENGIEAIEKLRALTKPDLAAVVITGATESGILKRIRSARVAFIVEAG